MKLDLTRESSYLIAAAIRGPDSIDPAAARVKNITTAVIRHFCGVRWGGAITYSPDAAKAFWARLSLERQAACRRFIQCQGHFTNHVLDAFDQLVKYRHTAALRAEAADYLAWLKAEVLK